jgi:hypothetical protein
MACATEIKNWDDQILVEAEEAEATTESRLFVVFSSIV